jgi:hypothetical protein
MSSSVVYSTAVLVSAGADVAPLHQLLNMKVDWGHVSKCFGSLNRAGSEGTGNPKAGVISQFDHTCCACSFQGLLSCRNQVYKFSRFIGP